MDVHRRQAGGRHALAALGGLEVALQGGAPRAPRGVGRRGDDRHHLLAAEVQRRRRRAAVERQAVRPVRAEDHHLVGGGREVEVVVARVHALAEARHHVPGRRQGAALQRVRGAGRDEGAHAAHIAAVRREPAFEVLRRAATRPVGRRNEMRLVEPVEGRRRGPLQPQPQRLRRVAVHAGDGREPAREVGDALGGVLRHVLLLAARQVSLRDRQGGQRRHQRDGHRRDADGDQKASRDGGHGHPTEETSATWRQMVANAFTDAGPQVFT